MKKRNQALCNILSKGECELLMLGLYYPHKYIHTVSTKADLLEQVEQLTSEKDELALEVNLITV